MNSNRETERIVDRSQPAAVKVAGFMLLFCFLVPSLNWALVLSKFIVAENAIATAKNIMANDLLFRIGITVELVMSVGLVVLAIALYTILKPVNKSLALLALGLKLTEAAIAAVIVLVFFIALQFINGQAHLTAFTTEQMQTSVGFLFNKHTVLYSVPMVFLGLDMMIFFYLFLKSKYIPKLLAAFGILSFALIFFHAMGNILTPEYAALPVIEIICYTPSCLLEIIMGIWLLVKGVNIL